MFLGEDISNPKLPNMVENLAKGKFPSRDGPRRRGKRPADISVATMAITIACSKDALYANFNVYDKNGQSTRLSALLYNALDTMLKTGKEMCDIWDVKPLEGAEGIFKTDVPSLVMASDIDSSTPIKWSRETMQYLNNGRFKTADINSCQKMFLTKR